MAGKWTLWKRLQKVSQDKNSQAEKFKQAARELECDPDEAKWEDKLRKVVKHKPVPGKPE